MGDFHRKKGGEIMTEKEVQSRAKSESFEWPFKGNRGQNAVKNECKERRMQLLGVVKKIGIRNATDDIKIWAKHYNVSERTIYKDFKWIKGNYKPSKIEEIKIDLEVERDQSLKQALRILSTSTNNEEKIRTIAILIQAGKHVREELEAWGLKPKEADPIKIIGQSGEFQGHVESWENIYNKLTKEEQEKLERMLSGGRANA